MRIVSKSPAIAAAVVLPSTSAALACLYAPLFGGEAEAQGRSPFIRVLMFDGLTPFQFGLPIPGRIDTPIAPTAIKRCPWEARLGA